MTAQLTLEVKDYRSDAAWRWVLSDADGRFLADHEVKLDPADPLYRGFANLPRYLHNQPPNRPEDESLAELGVWMGANVFGIVGEKLLTYEQRPARVVLVRVPAAAQELLFRPLELAHLGGKPLVERGFRFIYTLAGAPPRPTARKGITGSLRFLAVFSLPQNASPLNLRRERYEIQRQLRRFAQTRGAAVEVRVIQYGATRETLKEALEEDPGWDVIHFSGHGDAGELLLERADGRLDRITTGDLTELLQPTKARLKLLMLSACYSGAADLNAARRMIGLAAEPRRAGVDVGADVPSAPAPAPAASASALPSLAQRLAAELDCAALAMRYPVGDDFATTLGLELYDALLDKRQPLPGALQTALGDALDPRRDPHQPGFSRITPILFGTPAADLRLPAPARPPEFRLPAAGLFDFPPEPERFVGRLMPMLRASQAFALQSDQTGVLFYGMAGAGKTSCALELAYRHERDRFTAGVWHKAPDEDHDIEGALTQWALKMEDQLPGLELVGLVDDPQDFRRKALPRLRALMEQKAILLVMDNLESLLTGEGEWRDARWGELMDALLNHRGPSRLALTSRRLPNSLARDARVRAEAIHALSFGESVVLARDLPHLKTLFKSPETLPLLRRILEMAQGHPKLLELADGLAADPDKLAALLQNETEAAATLAAFFRQGETARSEDAFMAVLYRWTDGVAASLGLAARLLFHFLARLEDDDRTRAVIDANWEHFLKRLLGERGPIPPSPPFPAREGGPGRLGPEAARAALDSGKAGLDSALSQLAQAGLAEIIAPEISKAELQKLDQALSAQLPPGETLDLAALQSAIRNQQSTIRIHPGVAEAARAAAEEAVLKAADIELGDYFIAVWQQGMKTEMQGGGRLVVQGARHAAPYLMRSERWEEASTLLENVIVRDRSPAALGLAIPLLRRIAAATADTELGLGAAGVLASALLQAGRYAEAETALHEVIDRCMAQGNYRLASANAGDLLNLLQATGRLEEALQTAEAMADYTRRAGLGPWTQLSDECQRLQVLNAKGRYAEVLAAVEKLRPQLKALSEQSEADETANPWNVREGLLDASRSAAMRLEQWEIALALNAEILDYTRQRGADEAELAGAAFNDYFPLLRLERYREARALLEGCRAAFEGAGEIANVGKVYNALADLEDKEGNRPAAVRFEQLALRYKYQAGQPEGCAISHHNLANCLERSAAAPETVLAHRLADGVICFQIGSGGLAQTIRNLARSSLPPAPPPFEQVCAIVEQVVGVRFRELFTRLPQRAPSGDAAIAAVWEMALKEKDEGGRMKDENMQAMLREFEPLLQDITAVARGDQGKREEIEARLPKLEEKGWRIAEAARRIWAGERDPEALTAGLDEQDSALVRRALELLIDDVPPPGG
jgi:tetratricopeptide (TPR) repeat protein